MNKKSAKDHYRPSKKPHLKKLLNFLLDVFGRKSKKSFSSVIFHLTEAYEKEGLITSEEKNMFRKITSLDDKVVSKFMTPRVDIVAIEESASLEDIKKAILTQGHTRIPVYRQDFDDVVGFIHSKDLARFLCGNDLDFSVSKIMRKILFVPGSMKLMDVMLKMRTARIHLAIVMDEFGGVDGIVTIENIMEEIVGNIEDEHDLPSEGSFFRIKKIGDEVYQFGGRVTIGKFEEIVQSKVRNKNDDFNTMAGLMMSLFKRVPDVGEEIRFHGLDFKIIDADSRLVKLIEVKISSQ